MQQCTKIAFEVTSYLEVINYHRKIRELVIISLIQTSQLAGKKSSLEKTTLIEKGRRLSTYKRVTFLK